MVNEERLHHMIKMAIFDTNQGKECKPMTQYARKDYVSLRMLGSFVSGTIGFALILVTWGIYSMNQLMEYQMASINRGICPGLETVFLPASPAYQHFSSTMVREMIRYGQPMEQYVPAPVAEQWKGRS